MHEQTIKSRRASEAEARTRQLKYCYRQLSAFHDLQGWAPLLLLQVHCTKLLLNKLVVHPADKSLSLFMRDSVDRK